MNTSIIFGTVMLVIVIIGGYLGLNGELNQIAGPVPASEIQAQKRSASANTSQLNNPGQACPALSP